MRCSLLPTSRKLKRPWAEKSRPGSLQTQPTTSMSSLERNSFSCWRHQTTKDPVSSISSLETVLGQIARELIHSNRHHRNVCWTESTPGCLQPAIGLSRTLQQCTQKPRRIWYRRRRIRLPLCTRRPQPKSTNTSGSTEDYIGQSNRNHQSATNN